MLRRIISTTLLAVTLWGMSFQVVFAKPIGDWKDIAKQTNNEIAIKTKKGETIFGKLTSANDSEIILQIADKKELTNQNRTFQKSEIKMLWVATLRFKGNPGLSTAVGAGIGAGAAGGIAVGTVANSDSGTQYFWTAVAIGAGVGAVLGYFYGRRSHQKGALIYEI